MQNYADSVTGVMLLVGVVVVARHALAAALRDLIPYLVRYSDC